jgi:hypothetical protein
MKSITSMMSGLAALLILTAGMSFAADQDCCPNGSDCHPGCGCCHNQNHAK